MLLIEECLHSTTKRIMFYYIQTISCNSFVVFVFIQWIFRGAVSIGYPLKTIDSKVELKIRRR